VRVTATARAAATAYEPDQNQLVLQHVPLVKALAHRLAQRLPAQVEVTDLISVGMVGLIEAARRYRPATGVPFEAFARRRLKGAMLDALRDLDWAPRSLRQLRRRLDTAVSLLRRELGREPDEPQVAEAMGLTQQQYEDVLEQLRSLELGTIRQVETCDGRQLLDLCIDPEEGPDLRLERRELAQLLAKALAELPERERQILALYYEEELTLAEIGQVLGVTESRISQLRSLALSRLRTSMREALAPPREH
jgi:RNA polymerase sigma factor for flagellar operon FliA